MGIKKEQIISVFIFILFNNTYSIFYRNVYDNQSSNIVIGLIFKCEYNY